MTNLVAKVVTGNELTFHDGVLVPVGGTIVIDTDKIDITSGNTDNIADAGNAPRLVAVPVAPIAPTGPFPTAPQQIPPGVMQTSTGYATPDGSLLVAEGAPAAYAAAVTGNTVEEEAPTRRGFSNNSAADTAALALIQSEREELAALRAEKAAREAGGDTATFAPNTAPASDGFNPDNVIVGTIPEVSARLDGLSREQLALVRDAEQDREQPRSGVGAAIDAALAKLDAKADEQ